MPFQREIHMHLTIHFKCEAQYYLSSKSKRYIIDPEYNYIFV